MVEEKKKGANDLLSVFRAKESLLCLRAVLTGLSFAIILKSGGGSSHTFQRIVVVPSEETAEPSDWFDYRNNSDSTACPERNEATCDSVHVVKSDRREQDLEKQRSRNPNFS